MTLLKTLETVTRTPKKTFHETSLKTLQVETFLKTFHVTTFLKTFKTGHLKRRLVRRFLRRLT